MARKYRRFKLFKLPDKKSTKLISFYYQALIWFFSSFFNLGYANEVGEAFRPLVHKYWVYSSYGIATLYVLADTADKTIAADKTEKTRIDYQKSKVVKAAVDTLVWQGLASVIIPGMFKPPWF